MWNIFYIGAENIKTFTNTGISVKRIEIRK